MTAIALTPIDFTSRTLHSLDIIARIEHLEEILEDEDLTPQDLEDYADEIAELALLKNFASDGETMGDWVYGQTFIHEDYFTEHCKEIEEIPADLPSYIEIDWDATADNLRSAYTTFEVDGNTYYAQ